MDIEILQFVLYGVSIVLVVVLIVLGIQAVQILCRVKRITERVELLSDIKGWLGFLRKLPSKTK